MGHVIALEGFASTQFPFLTAEATTINVEYQHQPRPFDHTKRKHNSDTLARWDHIGLSNAEHALARAASYVQ